MFDLTKETVQEGTGGASNKVDKLGFQLLSVVAHRFIESKNKDKVKLEIFLEGTEPAVDGIELPGGTKLKNKGLVWDCGIYFVPTDLDYVKKDIIPSLLLVAEKANKLTEFQSKKYAKLSEMLNTWINLVKNIPIWFLVGTEDVRNNETGEVFTLKRVQYQFIKKDEKGNKFFNILVKEKDSVLESKLDDKQQIIEISGKNTLGENKDKPFSIKFDEKYHIKKLKGFDKPIRSDKKEGEEEDLVF
jgi:hypothetical protein